MMNSPQDCSNGKEVKFGCSEPYNETILKVNSTKRKRNRRKRTVINSTQEGDILSNEPEPERLKETKQNTMSLQNAEKSKEQILAERKMKKAAKKSGNKQESQLTAKPNTVDVKSDKKQETQPASIQTEDKKDPIKSPPKIDANDAEKSREDIKAEREAKKLAKQAKKNKSDSNSTTSIANNPDPASGKSENKENDKPEAKTCTTSSDITVGGNEKSKAELRAERRAKQEAQRAAKEASKAVPIKAESKPASDKSKAKLPEAESKKITPSDKSKPKLAQNMHKVKLFNHLYAEKEQPAIPVNFPDIHRAIIRLGVQYASHTIIGSNARCIALLNALKEVVRDYSLPLNVEFSRGFEAHLAPCLKFLNSCRLPAVSMNNALKHIKWQLTQLPNSTLESDGKAKLYEAIDVYIKDQIEVAGKAISIAVTKKIAKGDVILTYGCSSLIENILVDAAAEKEFRVVIVEARPWNEGKEMLRRLTVKGIKCSLVMISALSFVMREINKVILGAGALLANGYVMARAGTAQVAMVAHAFNVPVLVCCETHKFSERVQTDSFVYNEIGDPDDLIDCNREDSAHPLANWRSYNMLSPLNLFYDVTPPDLVTAVVTELAILPCTSVPVILRMKPSEFM